VITKTIGLPGAIRAGTIVIDLPYVSEKQFRVIAHFKLKFSSIHIFIAINFTATEQENNYRKAG
jgi:azurin